MTAVDESAWRVNLDEGELTYVRALLRERTGIVLDASKRYLVEARLEPIVRERALDSINALVREVRLEPRAALAQRVLEALVTTETSFFRDVAPFEVLRRTVVPELVRRGAREVRVWSAACSSGQEAWSIAMVLHDAATPFGMSARVLATDVSEEMLARARAGVYAQHEVNRGLPAWSLVRYFERRGLDWRIGDALRPHVEFRRLNLVEPWPALAEVDVAFVRNVLMYFDEDARRAVLGRLKKVLRPDGWLFLGAAETTHALDDAFEWVPLAGGGCHRRRASRARDEGRP